MTTPSSGGGGFEHQQTNRGGADAVPDTPGVPPRGAHPGGRPPESEQPTSAPVESRGGFGMMGWIIVAVLILVALVYGLGFVAR